MIPLDVVTPVRAYGAVQPGLADDRRSGGQLRRSCCWSGEAADAWGHLLGVVAPWISFVIGVSAVREPARPADVPSARSTYRCTPGSRAVAGTSTSGCLIDQLSILFVLLITGVGGLIHVYSIGYMAHDERRRKFFAFLNLFVAAMLLLVLADNYLVLFVGWEGVGLASYLLIGFWQHKPSAATAAKKAFVVNRVGDMGMSIAIMLMLATFGSSAFLDVNAGMPKVSQRPPRR